MLIYKPNSAAIDPDFKHFSGFKKLHFGRCSRHWAVHVGKVLSAGLISQPSTFNLLKQCIPRFLNQMNAISRL
jgi:hypothetical protein